MTTVPQFTVLGVVPKFQQSRELGAPDVRMVRVGITSVLLDCISCGETWTATEHGRGRFRPALGGVMITCPSCKRTGTLSSEDLHG